MAVYMQKDDTKGDKLQAFENTSSSVAASQMRNALNALADTVEDPKEKEVRYPLYPCVFSILTEPLAVRDRDGQLLQPLPPLSRR